MTTTTASDNTAAATAEVWTDVCRLHTQVTRRIAADLDLHSNLPLATYEILTRIDQAGNHLRLSDLLETTLLSQPGLSRKIERLQADGLIQRRSDPGDRRAILLNLTPAGQAAITDTTKVHQESIHRHLVTRVRPEELAIIGPIIRRLLEHQPRALNRVTTEVAAASTAISS
jgi:DNA-binding MarR family transcriptional regulator